MPLYPHVPKVDPPDVKDLPAKTPHVVKGNPKQHETEVPIPDHPHSVPETPKVPKSPKS